MEIDSLMKKHPYRFNGQVVYYAEYGAGAEIVNQEGNVIADFKSHLDAEAFLDLLNKPQWISVKDKSPEEGVEILALDSDYSVCFQASLKGHKWQDCFGRIHNMQGISHWMPLPESPKQEARE